MINYIFEDIENGAKSMKLSDIEKLVSHLNQEKENRQKLIEEKKRDFDRSIAKLKEDFFRSIDELAERLHLCTRRVSQLIQQLYLLVHQLN